MNDPNNKWTPEVREARARELDGIADARAQLVVEGRATQEQCRGWMRCRQWARKLRGQEPLTAEQFTAELVGLGLPL